MKIATLSGSLRKNSLNSALLCAAGECLLPSVTLQMLANDLPLYSEELEGEHTPEVIANFKSTIADADGLLIATPEYNHSFSGVLKNALDWASRPAFDSPLKGKKIALVSASMSPVGGARAQAQLRPVLASVLSDVYPGVEFLLPNAHKAFDEQFKLTDKTAEKRLQRFIEGFLAWSDQR